MCVCVRVCLDTLQCLHSVFVLLNEETSRGENFPSVLGGWLAVAWQQLIPMESAAGSDSGSDFACDSAGFESGFSLLIVVMIL